MSDPDVSGVEAAVSEYRRGMDSYQCVFSAVNKCIASDPRVATVEKCISVLPAKMQRDMTEWLSSYDGATFDKLFTVSCGPVNEPGLSRDGLAAIQQWIDSRR